MRNWHSTRRCGGKTTSTRFFVVSGLTETGREYHVQSTNRNAMFGDNYSFP